MNPKYITEKLERKRCFECGELFYGEELVCEACAEIIHTGFKVALQMPERERRNLEFEANE